MAAVMRFCSPLRIARVCELKQKRNHASAGEVRCIARICELKLRRDGCQGWAPVLHLAREIELKRRHDPGGEPDIGLAPLARVRELKRELGFQVGTRTAYTCVCV
jgi:hypothetical protein